MARPAHNNNLGGPATSSSLTGQNDGSITNNWTTNNYAPTISRPETPPSSPDIFVPFPRDTDFVHRPSLSENIHTLCSQPAARVALVGLGGIGKSRLAIEHCHRTHEQPPKKWVFWVHANSTEQFEQDYRAIADHVKIRGRKCPDANVPRLVYDWLRNRENGPWLLILDNVDSAGTILKSSNSNQQFLTAERLYGSHLEQHLAGYIPPNDHGSLLITSRTAEVAARIVGGNRVIPVEPMDDMTACALLRRKLGPAAVSPRDDDDIAELAKSLDYIPLALVQAAIYIRRMSPRFSIQQYLKEYRRSDDSKIDLLTRCLQDDPEASRSVLMTWQISFETLQGRQDSAAAHLLSLMSFFDPDGIQDFLLRDEDAAEQKFNEDILTLRDYSFITMTEDGKTFKMHRLVQLATRRWLEKEDRSERFRGQFVHNLCIRFVVSRIYSGIPDTWDVCQTLFPHVKAALTGRPMNNEVLEEWAELLYNAGRYAYSKGKMSEAEQLIATSLEVRKSLLGTDHLATLAAMDEMSDIMIDGGRYKEAEPIVFQSLDLKQKVLVPDHEEIFFSLMRLGHIYDWNYRYQEAETIYKKVLENFERTRGIDNPDTIGVLNHLGNSLSRQGRYHDAEAILQTALERDKKVFGTDHQRTLRTTHVLAKVFSDQKRNQEAEILLQKTLAREEAVLGPEHPDTLLSMHNLAFVLKEQGKRQEAESLYRTTLSRQEQVLGHEHADTLSTMHLLAFVLYEQGKVHEAEELYRKTLARREKTLGPDHRDTLTTAKNLAYTLASSHCYEESLGLLKRACTGYEAALEENHERIRNCRMWIAHVLTMQKEDWASRQTKTLDTVEPKQVSRISMLSRVLGMLGIQSSRTAT
ncbi:hypothetical protein NX059_004535 [Plenodomus lindquistii]|nr:hypothetical protein NX059_004535 [Plenodomus lindquistii]